MFFLFGRQIYHTPFLRPYYILFKRTCKVHFIIIYCFLFPEEYIKGMGGVDMKGKFFVLVISLLIILSGCDSTSSGSEAVTTDQEQTASQPVSNGPDLTMGQKNALGSANNYLSVMAFSHDGLIKQLMFDKYLEEDATYAADNCGADWNEQAAKAADNYLNVMSFSRENLINQLMFDGFSEEQAEYGVTAAGY